jgi:Protein of unknown function (DUF1573)
MKSLFKKTWFQMIIAGVIIGLVLIVMDNKFDFLGKKTKNSGEYNGPVSGDKKEMYITTASYSENQYDFGKVKEGDTVRHVFTIKNTGKDPLFIFKANGSCECIRAFVNTAPIKPGGSQDFTVGFLTKGRKGKQVRTVMIDTNTDPAEMVLTFTGEVE